MKNNGRGYGATRARFGAQERGRDKRFTDEPARRLNDDPPLVFHDFKPWDGRGIGGWMTHPCCIADAPPVPAVNGLSGTEIAVQKRAGGFDALIFRRS